MPQLDFDGANSKISADKIQGQSGTVVTVPTGHKINSTDATGIEVAGTAVKAGDWSNASSLASGTVPTARLGSGTASSSTFLRGDSTYAAAGGGKIANYTVLQTNTHSSGTFTGLGIVDTTPTSANGHLCMSLAITPTNASNILIIHAMFFGSISADGNPNLFICQDSISNSIAAWRDTSGDSVANRLGLHTLIHKQPCTSTDARTYHVRMGGASTGTAYFLGGQTSGAKMGTVRSGTMLIYELEV